MIDSEMVTIYSIMVIRVQRKEALSHATLVQLAQHTWH